MFPKKMFICLLAIGLLFLTGCSMPYRYYNKPLTVTNMDNARTVLILKTEYRDDADSWYTNRYNLQIRETHEGRQKIMEQYVHPLSEANLQSLYTRLKDVVIARMTAKDVPDIGLDKTAVYYSHDFPIVIPDDQYRLTAVYRDFSSLAEKGYTYALIIGVNNTLNFSKDNRMLSFGFNGILFDIRKPVINAEIPEERDARALWRFHFNQAAMTHTTSVTYLNPFYGSPSSFNSDVYSTTYYTKWSERVCLQVACVDEHGAPLTLERMFDKNTPLYYDLYVKAALVNMEHAIKHMKTGNAGNVKVMTDVTHLLLVPNPVQ